MRLANTGTQPTMSIKGNSAFWCVCSVMVWSKFFVLCTPARKIHIRGCPYIT